MFLLDFFDTGERIICPCNPRPVRRLSRFRTLKPALAPALAPVPSTARESGGSGGLGGAEPEGRRKVLSAETLPPHDPDRHQGLGRGSRPKNLRIRRRQVGPWGIL